MQTCAIDGCDKVNRAKGLCGTHYNQTRANRHAKTTLTCDACGTKFTREARANRYTGTYCSWTCRAPKQWATERASKAQVAIYKPAPTWHKALANMPSPIKPSTRVWTTGPCAQCGQTFTDRQAARFCQPRCSKAWHRNTWKAKTNRIVPPETRAKVYARDNATCQLCFTAVDMALASPHPYSATVDHIICQSWTLIPDHGEHNLRLAHRQCNSERSDEGVYARTAAGR